MTHEKPRIDVFVLGHFQTSCHVVSVPGHGGCWIVDAGYEPEPLIAHVEASGLSVEAILLTHCHADHIAGLDQVLRRVGPASVYTHELELSWCDDPMLNLSGLAGAPVTVTTPDQTLTGGETLTLGGSSWSVVHVPGHSPGSVMFVEADAGVAIVGDTLFAGSIGRFDFPTSNADDLRHTINEVIMSLPDEMTIYPGHGPSTTIGEERRSNPFVIHGF